ncbi:DUF2280 domain-containing protein [Paraburkholderia sp. Tr-20389]|uniref:DUF2280 domain-containing protein n=1 Tax=Paraburkholderia sp. Tr-20389 TaxID=2703903 RepID=UPI00197DE666|nr:DUF2280 domain-containing protein [Paraburkholderia sp. Tr-20389]MBN3755906.1 DUF2280 domain-containing protein [Paraburkholderia sp. Tr-20389]
MAVLTEDLKLAIVRALACYDSPKQVARCIKEEFGVTVSPQQVESYDPEKYAGRALSKKWRAIFEQTRKSFLEDIGKVSVANAAVRLRRIERLANKAEDQGNVALALNALEQAAKEAGGAFTNKTRVEASGPNGAPIPHAHAHAHAHIASDVTPDEYAKVVRQVLDEY